MPPSAGVAPPRSHRLRRTSARADLGPIARYEIRARFRAPLPFVFRWCTDYASDDGRRAQEPYERRVLERTARRVVLEDLESTDHGWAWKRTTVTLDPPDHWRAESVGNYRWFRLHYRLRPLQDGTTELRLRGDRRATALGGRNPSRAVLERELVELWARLGRSLEQDYRAEDRRSVRQEGQGRPTVPG